MSQIGGGVLGTMDGHTEQTEDVPLCLNPDNIFSEREFHEFPLPRTETAFLARISFIFDTSVVGRTNELFARLMMGEQHICEPPKAETWLAMRKLAKRKSVHSVYEALGNQDACVSLTELHQLLRRQQCGRLGLLPIDGRKTICFVPIGERAYEVECYRLAGFGWCVDAYNIDNSRLFSVNTMVLFRGCEPIA